MAAPPSKTNQSRTVAPQQRVDADVAAVAQQQQQRKRARSPSPVAGTSAQTADSSFDTSDEEYPVTVDWSIADPRVKGTPGWNPRAYPHSLGNDWEGEAIYARRPGSDTLPVPPLRASTPERPAKIQTVDFLDSDEVSDSSDGEGETASPPDLPAKIRTVAFLDSDEASDSSDGEGEIASSQDLPAKLQPVVSLNSDEKKVPKTIRYRPIPDQAERLSDNTHMGPNSSLPRPIVHAHFPPRRHGLRDPYTQRY